MLRLFLLSFGYHEYWCCGYLYIIFCVNIFSSLRYICRSGIIGSCDNCFFFFLRNCLTVFLSGSTILCSLQQHVRVPDPPHTAILWMCSSILLWLWLAFTSVIHWPCFLVLVGCLYAFFGQMPIESVYVLVGLSFLLMNFKSSFWLADLYEVIWLWYFVLFCGLSFYFVGV